METASLSNPDYHKREWVCRYLDRLSTTRMRLKITSADEVKVEDPYKSGDNQYSCTAHLYQKYVRRYWDTSCECWREYIDWTKKNISAIIEIRQYFDGYQYVKRFIIKLDDCEVQEVTSYYNN